jgi:hypothetical protein
MINLVAFYNLSASEIWPYKTSDLWWDGPYEKDTN